MCVRSPQVVHTLRNEGTVAVCDIQFDPFSREFVLCLYCNGEMELYMLGDLALSGSSSNHGSNSKPALVMCFAKQPASRRAAAFLTNEPGSFVTMSSRTGVAAATTVASTAIVIYVALLLSSCCALKGNTKVCFGCCFCLFLCWSCCCSHHSWYAGSLQVWNVSQQQPLRTLKTGVSAPAQSVQMFPGCSRALLTFQDGTLLLYDVSAQRSVWRSQPGHTETIFDTAWSPENACLLATCSYDGTVRVWDASTCECVKILDQHGTSAAGGSATQGKLQLGQLAQLRCDNLWGRCMW